MPSATGAFSPAAPLAAARHSVRATRAALLVTVAPLTPSICAPCASRICAASLSPAAAPMPSVSPETSKVTSVMDDSSTVTVTVTSLWKPADDAL